jgi:hypothetical protein
MPLVVWVGIGKIPDGSYPAFIGNMAFSGQIWAHTPQPTHWSASIVTFPRSTKNAGHARSLTQSLWFLHLSVTVKAFCWSRFKLLTQRVQGSCEMITDTPL